MKLKIFLLISATVFFTSCGSSKKVINTSPKPVVLHDEPLNEVQPELPQLEPVLREAKTNANHTEAYIQKFAPIAVKKMHEYNIPASITLAQGVLESGSGRSPLAIRSNNHFGIKCHKGWEGKSVTHDDDEIGECFRKYKYPETSYEDHSKFLTSRSRYAKLFKLNYTDYRGWAYGLKRAGYATDPRYPNKLIGIIKKYNLEQYDRVPKNPKQKINFSTPVSSKNYYEVQKGDTLYSIARKHNVSVKDLKEVNELTDNTISIGQQLIIN